MKNVLAKNHVANCQQRDMLLKRHKAMIIQQWLTNKQNNLKHKMPRTGQNQLNQHMIRS